MQHIFIDVEAYGPPGLGNPFSLGAAAFNMQRGVFARWQRNISFSEPIGATQDTLSWLSNQSPQVLAQMRGGSPFPEVWEEFLQFVADSDRGFDVCFWADDFADFGWLDFETRIHGLKPLREFGPQYDSSGILAVAGLGTNALSLETLVPHIAEHDAVQGALNLMESLTKMGRTLPE